MDFDEIAKFYWEKYRKEMATLGVGIEEKFDDLDAQDREAMALALHATFTKYFHLLNGEK